VEDFIKGDENIPFDVRARRGKVPASFAGKSSARACAAKNFLETAELAPAEKLLKEVTEPGAAEMKLVVLRAVGAGPARAAFLLPARRWLKAGVTIPIRAQRVVFLALGRIAQNLVGLADP